MELPPDTLKVLAYITRRWVGRLELLVFTQDDPAAGVQVPGGTVDPGEALAQALRREVAEECGLTDLGAATRLAVSPEPEYGAVRHVYHLAAPEAAPDRWTHCVTGGGIDHGFRFHCCFTALDELPPLAGGQDRWLPQLLAYLAG
jgi:ADP-ribose pyrophosphatase YjhB (NUDIX family)